MRLKIALVTLVAFCLLIIGFRPDALPYLRHNAHYSDTVLAHWPNAVFFRESVLERGEFPVWRETTMGGVPFAANPLNKTAYPLQWLVLLLPPSLHLNFLILLHLFIAGSGMWIWARSLGLRVEAAAISTLAYVLAPRIIGHIGAGHLDIFYALAWWPWLMWAARQMANDSGRRSFNLVQLALSAALLFLADIRVSLFAFTTAAIYTFIELNRAKQWKKFGWYGLAGGIFLLLTISLLAPLILWQPYMSRASLLSSDAGVLALEPIHFLGLILPAHRSSVETLTYLGLPVLTLAGIGLASFPQRVRLGWIVGLLFVALYAMGTNTPLWSLLVKLVPGLLWFRVPSKAWLILALLIPLLAGYGSQWLLEKPKKGFRFRRLELTIVILTAVAAACGIFALFILKLPFTMGISSLVGGLLLGSVLLLILNHRIMLKYIPVLLIALVFIDLAWTGYNWADWRGQDLWLNPGRPLAEELIDIHADRIYSPTYSLEQQVAEVYHLRLFGGVDPFQLAGVVQAVEQGSGVPVTKYDPVLPPLGGVESDNDVAEANIDAVIDTQILAEWQVSHVVAAYEIDNPRLEFVDNINGISIYKNLDYQLSTQATRIPDWPSGWPGLPDESNVNRFNQITVAAAVFSGIAFFMSIFLLFLIQLRRKRV
jgi:hypothetical protein